MNTLKQAFNNELMKIRHQRKAKILLVLTLAAAFLLSIGNFYFSSRTGFAIVESDSMSLSVINMLSGLLLPLVAFIMAVDSMSNEITSGTIKFGFMAPISRSGYFAAKLGALAVYNAVVLAGVFVITFVLNLFTMNGSVLAAFGSGLAAYVITIIPMTLVTLWGMLLGMFFSSGLSIGVGVILLLGVNVGQFFLPVLGSVSPLGYMNIYDKVIYGTTSAMNLVSLLLYLVSYYIILIAFGLLRLNSKEL